MFSNLPPGCSESDLPGNSPSDQAFERYCDGLAPEDLSEYWHEFVGDEPCDVKETEFWSWLREKFESMGED